MDAASNGFAPHRVDPGRPSDSDRTLYQWINGRTAKGVAVVSCRLRGRDYAATVTDFLSVSYDPPTMLLSLYSLSRIAEAVVESGVWALSLLAAEHTAVADALSEPGAPLISTMCRTNGGGTRARRSCPGPSRGSSSKRRPCTRWRHTRSSSVRCAGWGAAAPAGPWCATSRSTDGWSPSAE